MSVPMTSSNFERRDAMGQILPVDLRTYTLAPFDLYGDQIRDVDTCGEGRVSIVSTMSTSKGAGLQRPILEA